MPTSTIIIIGAFDTKGQDHHLLYRLITQAGFSTICINTGILGTTDLFPVDIEADQLAVAGGSQLAALREKRDRGFAMEVMAKGAKKVVLQLWEAGKASGIIGMGGTGGTSVICNAMRSLPIGFPKVCVSTAASGNTWPFVGTRDIVMIPSITDVAGINSVNQAIYSRAAGAIMGMVKVAMPDQHEQKPVITASMFGNTTQCVGQCEKLLTAKGFEVLIFHAVGTGGQTMEDLVQQGLVKAVLDITTTEWADELCEGVFSAGTQRLSAPGNMGIPHLIVPGCIDMVNYHGVDTIPKRFRDRQLYVWNPSVTLMRTNVEENEMMGKIFAEKANQAKGPVKFLIPLKGFSILDSIDPEKGPLEFWDPDADMAFIKALKQHLDPRIEIIEVDMNINEPGFSAIAVKELLEMTEN